MNDVSNMSAQAPGTGTAGSNSGAADPGRQLLGVAEARVQFGQVLALRGLSLEVHEGEIVALLGPNGAGKTTTLRAITGVTPLRDGRITFAGRRVDGTSPSKIARWGIASVPEGRRIFPDHTVRENLHLGGFIWRRERAIFQETLEDVLDLFPRLRERISQKAGTLSGGEAQMLAVGRALMLRPRLLVLDEPSLGLAPKVVSEMFEHLARLHSERGLTLLLVEQAATRALDLADRAYLLDGGTVSASGTSEQMRADPEIQRVYFGG